MLIVDIRIPTEIIITVIGCIVIYLVKYFSEKKESKTSSRPRPIAYRSSYQPTVTLPKNVREIGRLPR